MCDQSVSLAVLAWAWQAMTAAWRATVRPAPALGERLHPPPNLDLVPECAVLVQHKNGLACFVGTGRCPRGVQLHQGEQSVGFRLMRCDGGEHAAHCDALHLQSWGRNQSSPRAAV